MDGLDAGVAHGGGRDGVAVCAAGGIDRIDADGQEDAEGIEDGDLNDENKLYLVSPAGKHKEGEEYQIGRK